jgi:phage shock protein PspC (stress-responsive transcriptional regulator)
MLFGVAGGMADWFDLDSSVVRLVWALLILAAGVGILLYIVAAIVIPEEPLGMTSDAMAATGPDEPAASATGAAMASDDWAARRAARRAARAERDGGGAIIFGAILIALGGWFLLDRFVNINSALLLPGVLIALGAVLVLGALRRPGPR